MTRTGLGLPAIAFIASLAVGCSSSPPSAGFTNGDNTTLSDTESPKMRSDLPDPPPVDTGDAKLSGSAANIPDTKDASSATQPKSK
jgi:hypothetical protein